MTNAPTRKTNGVADVPTQFVVQFIANTQRGMDRVAASVAGGAAVDVVPAGGRSTLREGFGLAHALNRVVDADSWSDADTIACQMAMCHGDVVMAVSSRVLDGAL